MNRKITWTSTNTNVATVNDKGEVTAVGKGTCEVKATSEKNANVFGSCSVTVSEIEVESISLDKQTLKVGTGKTSETLNVTFTPANATNKTITWSSNPTSIATVSDGKVTGVKEGTATITATSANGKTATCSVTVANVMTIAEAKAKVTSYATLKQYIGTEIIDYDPTAGGTWRIFYYDEAGEFGTAGKLYLKRDFDNSLQKGLNGSGTYTNTDEAIIKMKAMNPKWAASTNASSIDLENEKAVAWLCNPANWTEYKTSEADYAIGSPSAEMYMKAFNVWETGNKDSTTLTIGNANGYIGDYLIEAGPNNIFMTAGRYWWLASPSSDGYDRVLLVRGDRKKVSRDYSTNGWGLCPVVSI